MPVQVYTTDAGLPAVEYDGELRVLGRLEPLMVSALPVFGSRYPVLPESEWVESSLLANYDVPVLNQGNTGSCVGHGSGSAMSMLIQSSGQPRVMVSPWYIYSRIRLGTGDNGAYVADAMRLLLNEGVCLDTLVAPNTIDDRKLSPEAKDGAKRYRLCDAVKITNWGEFGSALSRGFPVVFGIGIAANFNQLNAEGVAPITMQPVGGHCMWSYGLVRSPRYGWKAGVRNSWGTGFGAHGNCNIVEGHMKPYLDAFAMTSILDDPLDTTTDPPVVG